jgi:hypothetical protein
LAEYKALNSCCCGKVFGSVFLSFHDCSSHVKGKQSFEKVHSARGFSLTQNIFIVFSERVTFL